METCFGVFEEESRDLQRRGPAWQGPRAYSRTGCPCDHWRTRSPAEREWEGQGFCTENINLEFCPWKPCVVGVRGDIYPGCLGPYRLLGENVRNTVAACALPEALVPLILRKNKHLGGRFVLFKSVCLASFLFLPMGLPQCLLPLSSAPEGQTSLILKGKNL